MELAAKSTERAARLCQYCVKMCRHACTTHRVTRNDADTPNARAQIAYKALQRGAFAPEEVPYMYQKCANCGLCEEWCETPNMDIGAVMLAARADIVNQGLAPQSAVEVCQNVAECGNPYGEAPDERFAKLAGLLEALPSKAETLYFIGCETAYRQPEIAIATIRVLRAAGIDFTVLKSGEFCCGEPQCLLGFWEAAAETAKRNASSIADCGARRIVFNCPSCLKTFKRGYPERGVTIGEELELLHLSQLIEQLVIAERLALRRPIDKRATYHDPCELGRRQGIYEAPRTVIKAIRGLQFGEMLRSGSKADCCGAGGGLNATNLPLAIEASKSTVRMADDVQAELLVTACPTCKRSFLRHIGQRDGLDALDLVELVALAAGLE
ncbi:MAG: (Fe-S)-binding protein [Chloroflexota bacterium]